MRQIFSDSDLLAWHRNALLGVLGDDVAQVDEPQVGWFKRKLVRHGPWVPVRIWLYQPIEDGCLVRDAKLQAEVSGKMASAEQEWSYVMSHPITEAEYNYLVAAISWTEENAPDEPRANPREAIDWLRVPLPTF
jgi:hypothetical protein